MTKTKIAVCEKHGVEYEHYRIGKVLGKEVWSKCPECDKDILRQRETQEAEHKAQFEAERREYLLKQGMEYITQSGMPKRYMNIKPIMTPSFEAHRQYLKSKVEGVLFLSGDVGTGKTLFACEILKYNALKKPIYLTGQELSILSKGDYALTRTLDNISKAGLIILDEVNYLFDNILILDLIVDIAYRDGMPLVVIGNCNPEALFKNVGQRVASRLSQGFRHLHFEGKDLRVNGTI